MKTTTQIKILPTKEQEKIIKTSLNKYIFAVNKTVSRFVYADEILEISSKDIDIDLPSALRGQIVLDSKSIFKKYKKELKKAEYKNNKNPDKPPKIIKIPILKRPIAIWNNQNYKILENKIIFPVWIDGKCKRIEIKALIPTKMLEKLTNNKLGTLRITIKNNKVIAQIAVENEEMLSLGTNTMGVDLGLKIPAVVSTSNNKVKFFGNGRTNKYIKRKFRSKRKELGKAKKIKKLKENNNKEQRIMTDIDHKISRQIVNFAIKNNVSTIRLEQLANIRNTARTSRKNEKNLHTWSFYRLANFIEYKATLLGIKVEYVNPKYTSQICPCCGAKNHAKDRKYQCSCGFKKHRDIVGAMNIINAPLVGIGEQFSVRKRPACGFW